MVFRDKEEKNNNQLYTMIYKYVLNNHTNN